MKKTSLIFLTLVASCSVAFSAAQDTLRNQYPSDLLLDTERVRSLPPTDTIRPDSVRRDTVVVVQPVVYNYYYRSHFWNWCFRICRPRRYAYLIGRPGYVPRHTRGFEGVSSVKRGGFGRTGGAIHGTRPIRGGSKQSSGKSGGAMHTVHGSAS